MISNLDRTQFVPSVVLQEQGQASDDFAALGTAVYFDRGIKTVLRSFSPFHQSKHLIDMICCAKRIAKLITEQKFHLVHINSEACWSGNLAAKIAKTPAVSHLHGLSVLSPHLVGRLTTCLLNNLSNMLISTSNVVRDSYVNSGARAEMIRTVHNGINIDKLNPREVEPTLKAELGIDQNIPLVGMIANFDPRKGHHDFIDACKHVLEQNHRVQFVIVGNTEMVNCPGYFQQIKDKVLSLGIVDAVHYTGLRNDIPNVLASLDVVVQPSLTEAGPIVPIEAMAMERPIVVTDAGGNSEEVLGGQTGIVVPIGNTQAMSDAIIKLLVDNGLAKKFGVSGRQRVLKLFTNKIYTHNIQQIYKGILTTDI